MKLPLQNWKHWPTSNSRWTSYTLYTQRQCHVFVVWIFDKTTCKIYRLIYQHSSLALYTKNGRSAVSLNPRFTQFSKSFFLRCSWLPSDVGSQTTGSSLSMLVKVGWWSSTMLHEIFMWKIWTVKKLISGSNQFIDWLMSEWCLQCWRR